MTTKDENDRHRQGKLPSDPEADAVPMGANGKPDELRRLGDLLGDALQRAEARRTGLEKPIAVPWSELAEQLGGGLWPGLHVLVGGTGTGKSTLALQLALAAAKQDTPTGYIGLELGELDIALRALGEQAGVSWSRMFTGRASEADIGRATDARGALEALPFYVEFGKPTGWPAIELEAFAGRMRRAHPEQTPGAVPMLLVLDFLQIVGDELDDQNRPAGLDLRERIGRAAYFARDVARRLNVAVLAVSSVARDKYGALAGSALSEAGLGFDKKWSRRFVTMPDALVGMGKESGELEYSADSVTVAVKGPKLDTVDGPERPVVLVTAKGRATGAGWCALRFTKGQRFDAWQGSTEQVLEAIEDEKSRPKRPKGDDGAKTATPVPSGIG